MKIQTTVCVFVIVNFHFILFAQGDSNPVRAYVSSAKGMVSGLSDGTVDRFLGIPYAAPPVGDRRWKAPEEGVSWYGIRDATKPGNVCVQATVPKKSIIGDEDCLYLNVYRPANRGFSLLPVLIYIHGGSNQTGSGSDYDPSAMAAKGIVVVTMNYRLGAFGFLALPPLDAESGDPSSGNFGLMDQQSAMRWVRKNIAAFGGNPAEITGGGESAGGVDLCAHMTSPAVRGFFHRVFLWSFYCPAVSHDDAINRSLPVATAAGCSDPSTAVECLREKQAAEVLNAALSAARPGGGEGFQAAPNFGNSVLPVAPAVALTSGQWNWSAVLLGSNHDEAGLPLAAELLLTKESLPLTVEEYTDIVNKRFRSLAESVMEQYPLDQFSSPFIALADEGTDRSPAGCEVTATAHLFSATHEIFRFEFDDAAAPPPAMLSFVGFPLGAYHAGGVQYLFHAAGYPGPRTPAQQQLSEQMIEYWANFVKTGDPNSPGLPSWPRYDEDTHQLLSLRPGGSTVIDNFDADHRCAFWAAAGAGRGLGLPGKRKGLQ